MKNIYSVTIICRDDEFSSSTILVKAKSVKEIVLNHELCQSLSTTTEFLEDELSDDNYKKYKKLTNESTITCDVIKLLPEKIVEEIFSHLREIGVDAGGEPSSWITIQQ
jgi:hypothetical protein